MIYTIIEIPLIALCFYILYMLGKYLYVANANVSVKSDVSSQEIRIRYEKLFGVSLKEEITSENRQELVKKIFVKSHSSYLYLITVFIVLAGIAAIILAFRVTNNYWEVSTFFPVYMMMASGLIGLLVMFSTEKFMGGKKSSIVICIIFTAYMYFFMSFFSVCMGNLLYDGPEKVHLFRVEYIKAYCSDKRQDCHIYVSPADGKPTKPEPIREEQIPVPDRYMLAFVKRTYAPLVHYFETPKKSLSVHMERDNWRYYREAQILREAYWEFPQGSLIGVKVRSSYFGEVFAKDHIGDCIKVTD